MYLSEVAAGGHVLHLYGNVDLPVVDLCIQNCVTFDLLSNKFCILLYVLLFLETNSL